jgi:hypothetical protein
MVFVGWGAITELVWSCYLAHNKGGDSKRGLAYAKWARLLLSKTRGRGLHIFELFYLEIADDLIRLSWQLETYPCFSSQCLTNTASVWQVYLELQHIYNYISLYW